MRNTTTGLTSSLIVPLIFALGACDPSSDDDSSEDVAADDSDKGANDETDDGAHDDTDGDDGGTGDDGDDGEGPGLGDTPNVPCTAAMADLVTIAEQNNTASPDPQIVLGAYQGTEGSPGPLQQFVQSYGAWLGRVENAVLIDDRAILDLAVEGTPEALLELEYRIRWVASLATRQRIADVANAQPDAKRPVSLVRQDWDDAYCYWDLALRGQAQQADALGLEIEGIEDDIQGGFEHGFAGISEEFLGVDPWVVPPQKQRLEKSMFRAMHRLVVEGSRQAQANEDPLLARKTLGVFRMLADRLSGRNTPGIAIIEGYLTGPAADIDPADVEKQLNIAFAKRTRRYSSHAFDEGIFGTEPALTGAIEGRTYAKLILPAMAEALEDFDPKAHLEQWDDLASAIRDDDPAKGLAASEALTADLCAFQTTLAISACTGSDDEV